MKRRTFLSSGAAAVAAATLPGMASASYTVPEQHLPKIVSVSPAIPVGEIHVDPNRFYLYWTIQPGAAIRYVVGVGRPGLYEAGEFVVGQKRIWPSWRPTDDMIEREPDKYEQYKDGVPGGPNNPLGARGLYLHDARGRDTYLRIHGTPSPWTIGAAVSNGCARLINEHIAHLYALVPLRTRVVLYPQLVS